MHSATAMLSERLPDRARETTGFLLGTSIYKVLWGTSMSQLIHGLHAIESRSGEGDLLHEV
jgi:hypothetical protein